MARPAVRVRNDRLGANAGRCPSLPDLLVSLMSPISMLLIGFAMSTDAFAAAVGKGAAMRKPRFPDALRAGLIFGVIEAITPMIGWAIGHAATRWVEDWDHWIASPCWSGWGCT